MTLTREFIVGFMLDAYKKAIYAAQDWHYYDIKTSKLPDFIHKRGLSQEDSTEFDDGNIISAMYINDDKHHICHTLSSGGHTGCLLLKFS